MATPMTLYINDHEMVAYEPYLSVFPACLSQQVAPLISSYPFSSENKFSNTLAQK